MTKYVLYSDLTLFLWRFPMLALKKKIDAPELLNEIVEVLRAQKTCISLSYR